MTGFFLKKVFYETWDNILLLAVLNLGYILLLVLLLALPMLAAYSPLLSLAALCALIFLFFLYTGGVARFGKELLAQTAPSLKEIPAYIRSTWKVSFFFAGLSSLQILVLLVGFPFYLSIGGLIGLTAASILFWVSVLWFLISQWIYPVRLQLADSIKKVLYKSLLLFFDNPGLSIFLGLYSAVLSMLSVITFFLIPGPAGVIFAHQTALQLLMHKYDYLEENPSADRRHIPWESLLREEREKVGTRSLRGLIFPWKE
ncbi:MAG TPA: hypothetical protein ENN41_02555 [Sediminispirochaeta sp.]|nr:hypothetical protein [Sediminispirochaeta sp.]